jgi:glycosyltransferase involved in cell wall biosynthesis
VVIPSISVALCTRNGESYIEAQLESILVQDLLPDEVVLSDDASSDSTVAIGRRVLEEFNRRNPGSSVELLVHENPEALGVTRNFESAISRCSGDIIVLCDQDDVWHSSRLSTAVGMLETSNDELLFSDACLVGPEGAPQGLKLFDALEITATDLAAIRSRSAFSIFIKRNLATGATIAFRRSLLGAAQPFPASWLHDEWLAIIAAARESISVAEAALIDYRQHGSNEVGARKLTLRVKLRKIFEARGARNDKLAVRSRVLVERLSELRPLVNRDVLALAIAKAEFERERSKLPRGRWRRIRPVLALHRKGWYKLFASQGTMDIVRDLAQPH